MILQKLEAEIEHSIHESKNILGDKIVYLYDTNAEDTAIFQAMKQLIQKEVFFSFLSISDEIITYLNQNQISAILYHKRTIRDVNRLLWECDCVKAIFCVDTDNPYEVETGKSRLMTKKLWDFIGANAEDEIAAGGWVNSYTRELFTKQEMSEFAQNAYLKVQQFLSSETKVLEIGCASGLTMFQVCPEVKEYHAIDLSEVNLHKNQEKIDKLGYQHVHLYNKAAHEIADLGEQDFDLIIMNSVTQCLIGINYLRNVIMNAIQLMKNSGIIFVGDVMDLARKAEYYESLLGFKAKHPQYNTKLDLTQELYLSKQYFQDLCSSLEGIQTIEVLGKVGTIENELTRYRYDVLLYVDKQQRKVRNPKLNKYQLAQKFILERE